VSDAYFKSLHPELFRCILLETESRGQIEIPSTFSPELVIAHKILLGDADFAEVKIAKESLGGFLYPAAAFVFSLKRKGREFLRLSQNEEIWRRAINTVTAHGDGWTLTMFFDLLNKMHRCALKLDG
jgi:hypothetical protein